MKNKNEPEPQVAGPEQFRSLKVNRIGLLLMFAKSMNTPPFPVLLTAPVKVAEKIVELPPAIPSGAVNVTRSVKV